MTGHKSMAGQSNTDQFVGKYTLVTKALRKYFLSQYIALC